jgi:tRNA G37 N-methylase Trm5
MFTAMRKILSVGNDNVNVLVLKGSDIHKENTTQYYLEIEFMYFSPGNKD